MKRGGLAGRFLVFLLSLGMVFSTAIPLGNAAWADDTAPMDTVWAPLTDIEAAAASTKSVAITMTTSDGMTFALPSAKNTTGSPLAKSAEINADGKLVISGEESAYGWKVTKNEDEGDTTYTLQNPDDLYLYVINNNNGIRVNTTQGVWKVDDTNYLSSPDSATPSKDRYIGIYNKQDWRSYYLQASGSIHNNIKDQTLQFWEYEGTQQGEETPIVDISAALAGANGAEFKVKGVVTFIEGKNYYIQDSTGGICLYFSAAQTGVAVGDTLVATGSKTVYKGLPELTNAAAEKDTDDPITLVAAEKANLAALTSADICTYVKIPDLTVTEVTSNQITVQDAAGTTLPIYKPVLGDKEIAVNDILEFTGAVGMFDTMQLRNSSADEIVVTGSGEPPGPVETDSFGLVSTLADGDEVILYNAKSGKAVGNTITSNKVTGVSLSPTDGVIQTNNTDVVWTVHKDSNGLYSFTQGDYTLGGKANGTKGDLVLSDAEHTGFTLTGPDAEDFNYYLSFADWSGNYGNFYLEYYSGFTLYSTNSPNKDVYGITFYKKDATPETPAPPAGDSFGLVSTIADGDQVIIFNDSHGAGVGNTLTGHNVTAVSLTPANGVIQTSNESVVWTVHKDSNGLYSFTQEGKTLGGVVSGNYNNLVVEGATYTGFMMTGPDPTDFNYYLKFAGWSDPSRGPFYLEYYNGFSVYASKSPGKDAFGFTFYKKDAEPETPQGEPPIEIGDRITDLNDLDGEYVAIYCPNQKTAISTKANGDWYLKANAATITTQGKVDPFTSDFIWKAHKNDDGTYCFYSYDNPEDSITVWPSQNKENWYAELTVNTNYDNGVNKWELSPNDKFDNAYYIKSSESQIDGAYAYVLGNERQGAKNFAGKYVKNPTSKDYALQFYKVNPSDAVEDYDDGEWDGVLIPGKQYVIYNNANERALGIFKEANYSFDPIPSELVGNPAKIKAGNGAYVFTVGSTGRYYTFMNNGKYLATNNDEELFFVDPTADGKAPGNAKWYLAQNEGGYMLYSKDANYKGSPVCIEYFASAFSGWTFSDKNDIGIYLFNFYEAVEGTKLHDDIVQDPQVIFDCKDSRSIGQKFPVTVSLDDLCPDIENVSITFQAGSKTGSVRTEDCEISSDNKNYSFVIPASAIDSEERPENFTLTINVENGYDIDYSGSKTISIIDEPFIEDVTPAPGSQTGDEKKPLISATVGNVGEEPTIELFINDEKVESGVEYNSETEKLTYTSPEDMEDGRTTARIAVTRKDNVTASKTWVFTVGDAEYQQYFGQLHSHTTYSDGSGSLDTALDYIESLPESSNIQFVAFTDHSNYFDTTSAANPAEALNDKSKMTEASRQTWEEYKSKIAAFNADPEHYNLIAIGGFEMTWSGGPGHINTFDSEGLVSRNNAALNNKTNDAGMKLYYETINQGDSMNQFNHPGATFGNFTDFSYWDQETDDHMFLVEVGNGEGQIGAGGYYPSYEEYILALDKGWHVAPTNNQDNHKGRWGNANDARDVVLTNDFTEQGIYDAIRAMRIYSTEDKNLKLNYTVNGEPMGTIFESVPENLNVEVTTFDPDAEEDAKDKIQKVELVSNGGRVVKTWDSAEDLSKGYFEAELAPAYSYYFVRVTQADGDLAVTAPVWTGKSVSMGIQSFGPETEPGIAGQNLTLKATLENNTGDAVTVKSLVYTFGSQTLGPADTTGYSIPAGETLDVEYTYMPTAVMRNTVTLTAVFEVDGNEFTFTKDCTFSVRANSDPLEVVPISTVQAQDKAGYEYAIEGVVTSNASDYDKDTAFFDCIFVQDDSAGICVFPVSGTYKIGDKVHVEGYTDFYQGEKELQMTSIQIIGEGSVTPTVVTAEQINNRSMLGSLVTLNGTVESFELENGLIQTIMIKDDNGDVARVFIDGYITTAEDVADCEVGARISATGLASYDDTFNAPDGPFPRIRIRDRKDIICSNGDPAAAIGNDTYDTIQAAIDAAKAGDTVKLLRDVDINNGEELTVSKKLTLDLDGHTVKHIAEGYVKATYVDLIAVTEDGDLTITGSGAVTGVENGAACDGKVLISVDGGKLAVLNGTFTATGEGSDGMYGVYVLDGGTAVFGAEGETGGPTITSHFAAIGTNNTTAPATITVYGGTFTANANPTNNEWWSYFCAPVYAAASGTYAVEGGTFNGYYGISDRYANVTQNMSIEGGTFNAASGVGLFVDSVAGSAGAENRNITATTDSVPLPDGYTWVANGDGTFKVLSDEVITAKAKANADLDKINLKNYSYDELSNVIDAIQTARAAIEAADSIAEIEDAMDTAMAIIEAQPTNEDKAAAELANAKALANAQLDEIKPDDYSGSDKTAVENAISEARTAIEAAETTDEVNAAMEDARTAIAACKTDEQKEAQRLQTSKAIAEILINAIDVTQYSGDELTNVRNAIAAAREAVAAASTTEAVAEATSELGRVLDEQMTNEQKAAIALANAKETATTQLNSVDTTQYSGDELAAVQSAIETALAAIDAAETVDDVNSALAAANVAIAGQSTDAQIAAKELEGARKLAKAQLNAVDTSKYSEPEKSTVEQAIADGLAAIDAAEDVAGVNTALTTANSTIAEQPTAEQKAAIELQNAKDNASDALNAVDLTNYSGDELAAVKAAVDAARTAIKDAETPEAVNDAMTAAQTAIAEQKTDDQKAGEELQNAKDLAGKQLDAIDKSQYSGNELAAVEKAIADAKAAIESAKSVDDVNKAMSAANSTIASQKTNAQKAADAEKAADAKARTIKTVTVNAKTVNAKAIDSAVKKAGGSNKYVTKIVLGKKVKKIKSGAFKKYTKVTTIEVRSKKLKKKSVKGSLKGSRVKTVKVKVGSKKVNKKYVKKYKKIFTKKNAGKKVKIR